MDLKGYLLANEKLINIFCNIFTSIGTVLAVIVALYLSYRSNHPRPKLSGIADFKYFHADNDLPETEGIPIISVDIANQSIAPIEINAFGWIIGFSNRFIKKRVVYQYTCELIMKLSAQLPTVIPYGHDSQYAIHENIFIQKILPLFSTKGKCDFLTKLNIYFCYLFIQDSLGNFYYFRIEKDLRKKLWDAVQGSKQYD